MNPFKVLIFICFALILVNCGSNSDIKSPNFSLTTNQKSNTFKLGDTLTLTVNNKKSKEIKSISYSLDGKEIDQKLVLTDIKLGLHKVGASIVTEEDESERVSINIIVNNNQRPKVYGFKIINEYPHDISSYTQGLEFFNDTLYESTGQYGESKLRKVNFETADVLKNINLDKNYFGEGLTIINEKLYQLTWKSNVGFIYDIHTLERTKTFNYGNSKEGWGICNNGEKLFKTDGTEAIYTLNPETLSEEDKIEVYTNKGKIASLNELEWINGRIYANIYQRNGVAIIDPKNGAVEGVIDFSTLKEKVKQHSRLDVLNGIAYNPKRNTIFVTGKRWDKLFEVEIFEK